MANWLDRAISWVDPNVGIRRARARALLSYEAIRSERRQGGWTTTGTSGNAEIGVALSKIRNNARDMVRNNSYARRAVNEWTKRVVGYGIKPAAKTGDPELDKRINEYWEIWANRCSSDQRLNFYAAQKLLVGTHFVSGEALVRMYTRWPEDGLLVPFQIQLLEPDYLDTSKTETTSNGYIIQGIQFDKIGRIVGYWLFGNHPGDTLQTSLRGGYTSAFVSAQDILHHVEIDRIGDVRGMSRFAPVLNKLRDIDEYADAEIVRKKTEACLTAMVTQPDGQDGATMGPTAMDSSGNKIESFTPAMVMYGGPGADVKFFAPAVGGDYALHKETELREVAVGLGIPYILLDDNLRAVNYSSFRGGLIAYRDTIEEYRWNWLIPQALDPIWRRFIDTLYLAGEIPEKIYGVQWNPPPFTLLDRESEAEADRMELALGKKTWPQLIGETGEDAERQLEEIAAWKSRLDAAGVTFASSITKSGADNDRKDDASSASN